MGGAANGKDRKKGAGSDAAVSPEGDAGQAADKPTEAARGGPNSPELGIRVSGAAGDEDEKRHGNARDEERVALEEPADDVSRGISGQCGQNADARSPETHGAGTGAAKEVLLNDAGCGEQNRIGRAGKRTDKPHGKRQRHRQASHAIARRAEEDADGAKPDEASQKSAAQP